MKYLLFLAMFSLWLQCADRNQQSIENQLETPVSMNKEGKKSNYRYVDGNNNAYIISPRSVDYKPITKEMSSSGDYDGGEPVKKEIDEAQYTVIQLAINTAIENTAVHIDKRQMGSVLIWAEGKSYKIAYRAKEKAAIEKVLKGVIEE